MQLTVLISAAVFLLSSIASAQPMPKSKPKNERSTSITQVEARFWLGFSYANLKETSAIDETASDGLWSLPKIGAQADYWVETPGKARSWQFSAVGELSRYAPLDDVSFPVGWRLDGRVGLRTIATPSINPFLGIGGESFSQATPDRTKATVPTALTSRSTLLLKTMLGGTVRTDWGSHWVEVTADAYYAPSGSTKDNVTSLNVQGFGGELQAILGLGENLYSAFRVDGKVLTGDLKLQGSTIGVELGWAI